MTLRDALGDIIDEYQRNVMVYICDIEGLLAYWSMLVPLWDFLSDHPGLAALPAAPPRWSGRGETASYDVTVRSVRPALLALLEGAPGAVIARQSGALII